MKKTILLCVLALLFTSVCFGAPPATDLARYSSEAVNVYAEVTFEVLEVKQALKFGLIGEKKGFEKRLSRVTARLVTIGTVDGNEPNALAFLQKNAPEIDLQVVYHGMPGVDPHMHTGLHRAEANALLAAYAKDKHTRFKGEVTVVVAFDAQSRPHIENVYPSSVW